MKISKKVALALVAATALALSACGNSDSSSVDSAARTKNAALPAPGINVKSFTFKRESLTGWETHPTGVGLEDQIQRDEGKHSPCANGRTTIPSLDAASVKSIVDSCGTSQYLIVHYTGFITVPGTPGSTVSVKFHAIKDNTFTFKVGGVSVIDAWKNSPCAVVEGTIDIPAGKAYPINSWFMNFNSGYCSELSWSLDGGEMVVVPPSAFTRNGDESASLTTVAPTTTVKDATTTTTSTPEATAKKQVMPTTTTVKATTTTVADQTASGNAVSATTSTTLLTGGNATSAAATTVAPDEAIAHEASDSTVATSDTVAATSDTVADSAELASDADADSDSSSSSSTLFIIILIALIALFGVWFAIFRKKKE